MKQLSFLSILFLAFFGCRNDIDDDSGSSTIIEPPIIIGNYNPDQDLAKGTIFGRVYDEQENPVANALVTYDGKNYSTDEEGRFFIIDETLDKQGTFFTVEADGYFKGSRRLNPQDGSVNYANVQLLALNTIGTFNTANGGQVNGDDDISLTFAPNSIISPDGTLYNGEVSVAAKFLDPTAPNIGEIMPGNLLGLSSEIEEVSLVSYGMMAAELFGENGEKLNIAEGQTARLSFPVPADLLDSAPEEIPLWSFEEEQYGIWVEEGMASLQNGNYVGEVSHFSFWNCDVPFELVFIEGQLSSERGVPLANAAVNISTSTLSSSRYGNTDSKGFFAGKVPKGEELILRLANFDENCELNPISIGSFNADTNIGQVLFQDLNNVITISGKLMDCYGRSILNSTISIQRDGIFESQFDLENEDFFEISVFKCSNFLELIIEINDKNAFGKNTTLNLPISSDIDLGEVIVCDPIAEYAYIDAGGGRVVSSLSNKAYLSDNNSFITMQSRNLVDTTNFYGGTGLFGDFNFGMSMDNPIIGSFSEVDLDSFNITLGHYFLKNLGYDFDILTFAELECSPNSQSGCSTLAVEVLENGGLGGFIYVELSGIGKFITPDQEIMLPFEFRFRALIEEE